MSVILGRSTPAIFCAALHCDEQVLPSVSSSVNLSDSYFLSAECYKLPAVLGRICWKGGGSHLHQNRPTRCDVPEPSQRHRPPRSLQRHSHPLVTKSERSSRQDALSPWRCALSRCGQDGHVSHISFLTTIN